MKLKHLIVMENVKLNILDKKSKFIKNFDN